MNRRVGYTWQCLLCLLLASHSYSLKSLGDGGRGKCGDIPRTTTGPETTSHPSAYKSVQASKPSPHTFSPAPHQNPSTGNIQTNAASIYRYYSAECSRRNGVGTTLLLVGMYPVLDTPPGPKISSVVLPPRLAMHRASYYSPPDPNSPHITCRRIAGPPTQLGSSQPEQLCAYHMGILRLRLGRRSCNLRAGRQAYRCRGCCWCMILVMTLLAGSRREVELWK